MKVKFYGTRGSIPVCEPGFQEFGGNTTCVLLTEAPGRKVILDAGTGIRNLGKDLIASGYRQDGPMVIGFSHFHWDHIQGFPFFAPAYDPAWRFAVSALGREAGAVSLESIFAGQMQREYFPVSLDQMKAEFTFRDAAGDHLTDGLTQVASYRHCHPGGALSYRVEHGGSVLVYCTDVEHRDGIDPKVVALARDADLLIHDAQYTPEELRHRRGWGHSSWEQAVEVALRAGAKRVALTHHDPDHDDAFLRRVEEECRRRHPHAVLARERMEIEF